MTDQVEEMEAEITEGFEMVQPGDVYPTPLLEGDVVSGRVAEVAVSLEKAVVIDGASESEKETADTTQTTQGATEQTQTTQGASGQKKKGDTTTPKDAASGADKGTTPPVQTTTNE